MLARGLAKGKLLPGANRLSFQGIRRRILALPRLAGSLARPASGSPARRKACWLANAHTRALQGGALPAGPRHHRPRPHRLPPPRQQLKTWRILVLFLLLAAQPAHALRIQLRARTDLKLQATQEAAGLRVRGVLADSRGAPVGGAAVLFSVITGQGAPIDLQAMTNESGAFDAPLSRDRLPPDADIVHV